MGRPWHLSRQKAHSHVSTSHRDAVATFLLLTHLIFLIHIEPVNFWIAHVLYEIFVPSVQSI